MSEPRHFDERQKSRKIKIKPKKKMQGIDV